MRARRPKLALYAPDPEYWAGVGHRGKPYKRLEYTGNGQDQAEVEYLPIKMLAQDVIHRGPDGKLAVVDNESAGASTTNFYKKNGRWVSGEPPMPLRAWISPHWTLGKATRVESIWRGKPYVEYRAISKVMHIIRDGLPLCGQKLTADETRPKRWDPWLRQPVAADARRSVWLPSVLPPTCKRCLRKAR